MREVPYVSRGLTKIAEANQVRKNEPNWYFVPDQKSVRQLPVGSSV